MKLAFNISHSAVQKFAMAVSPRVEFHGFYFTNSDKLDQHWD